MSTTASPAPNRPKQPTVIPDRMVESPWHMAIPYLVFALIVAAVLVLMTLIFGQVNGEEFSPDTFERRRYHYFQIPILRFQVTGMKRKNMGIEMADTVEDHASNVDSTATIKNWDLVLSRRVGSTVWLGDAKILCDLLSTTGNSKRGFLWESWSEKYPHLADRFWPVVADTAQAGSYILLPDLFELAEEAGFDSAHGVDEEEDVTAAKTKDVDDDADESESGDDKDDEAATDEEEMDDESETSEDDDENTDEEKVAEDDGEDKDSEDDPDSSKVKKKKAKKKKKKTYTAEQKAEADRFESNLREFMAKETVILANQFENADELELARRAYELAIKYSDDPAVMENFDRLSELVPPDEEQKTPEEQTETN